MSETVSTVAPRRELSLLTTSGAPTTKPRSEPSELPQIEISEPAKVDTRKDRAVSMEEVQKAVETLRAAVDKYTPAMKIGFDGELNKMIVRVTDAETNEVIRELPPEEVLEIARFLERHGVDAVGSESLQGMLLDEYI